MSLVSSEWDGQLCHPLMAQFKISDGEFSLLWASLALYLSRALHLDRVPTSDGEISSLSLDNVDLSNVTPNGAVVPKREYQVEFNAVLGCWSSICQQMITLNPGLLSRFRLTPNIRIKFGQELEKNVNRPLNTGLPHSDAWVEGPWGMNCFLPIMGDCRAIRCSTTTLISLRKNTFWAQKPIPRCSGFLNTTSPFQIFERWLET